MDVQSHKKYFWSKAALWIIIHVVCCVSSNDAVTNTCSLCIRVLRDCSLCFRKSPFQFPLRVSSWFLVSWSFILYTSSLKYSVNKKLCLLPRSLALKLGSKKPRISFCWFQFNFLFLVRNKLISHIASRVCFTGTPLPPLLCSSPHELQMWNVPGNFFSLLSKSFSSCKYRRLQCQLFLSEIWD